MECKSEKIKHMKDIEKICFNVVYELLKEYCPPNHPKHNFLWFSKFSEYEPTFFKLRLVFDSYVIPRFFSCKVIEK